MLQKKFNFLRLISKTFISMLMFISIGFSKKNYQNHQFRLKSIKVVPCYNDSLYIVKSNEKTVWPLKWIPPKHLRMTKYTYDIS